MVEETQHEKWKRLEKFFAQKPDDELLSIYDTLRSHSGVAGNRIMISTIVKDELLKRDLIEKDGSKNNKYSP